MSFSGMNVHFCMLFINQSDTSDTNTTKGTKIKLVSGTENAGLVEIYLFGHWRGVCGHTWDVLDAVVACRELGYLTATASGSQRSSDLRIWPYSFACTGHESTLIQCGMSETNYDCYYNYALTFHNWADWAFVNCSSEYAQVCMICFAHTLLDLQWINLLTWFQM